MGTAVHHPHGIRYSEHHPVCNGTLLRPGQVLIVACRIQNGDKICGAWRDCGRFIVNCFYFAWYVATSILCFFIYREFKGISFDKNPELARFFPRNRPDQGATATHLQPQHFSSKVWNHCRLRTQLRADRRKRPKFCHSAYPFPCSTSLFQSSRNLWCTASSIEPLEPFLSDPASCGKEPDSCSPTNNIVHYYARQL